MSLSKRVAEERAELDHCLECGGDAYVMRNGMPVLVQYLSCNDLLFLDVDEVDHWHEDDCVWAVTR